MNYRGVSPSVRILAEAADRLECEGGSSMVQTALAALLHEIDERDGTRDEETERIFRACLADTTPGERAGAEALLLAAAAVLKS